MRIELCLMIVMTLVSAWARSLHVPEVAAFAFGIVIVGTTCTLLELVFGEGEQS